MGASSIWWDLAFYLMVFLSGMLLVRRAQQWFARHGSAGGLRPTASSSSAPPERRPANQIPVRGFEELIAETSCQTLVRSIERRTKLSPGNWQRDCQPVLEQFAEFVQMLPASEAHHHAQPGGLLTHALEVADAALTFRAGMEIPLGAGTEERKRDEHRWTVAVLLAALLHDVGKPVTDVRVTLFQQDARGGRTWTPMAGSMRSFSAHWYTVAFADATERDYKAHSKLGALLMQTMVPSRTLRWLSDSSSGDILGQLHSYLSGDEEDGILGQIVKRADSDSVRRNLMHGPRTRFASARVRPLIERLMEALRRMLAEGAQLPLNRPGAAGWVYDGAVWFVCARLADEVREYLAQHESAQGIPGKDKNDRLFDTWQEHGAVRTAPDGGAIWRVQVQCDAWAPPDAFTVLCFPLDKLYADPTQYPKALNGAVKPVASGAAPSAPVPKQLPAPVIAGPATAASSPPAAPVAPFAPAARPAPPRIEPSWAPPPIASAAPLDAVEAPAAPLPAPVKPAPVESPNPTPQGSATSASPAIGHPTSAAPVAVSQPPIAAPAVGPALDAAAVAGATGSELPTSDFERVESSPAIPDHPDVAPPVRRTDDVLDAHEAADLREALPVATTTPALTLTAPLRPRERNNGHPKPPKMPSPAAQAFLGWVATAVGSGELSYNEDGAMVHFVAEGALLLSPEIFRRFLEVHRLVGEGPIAELRAEHGENAYKRLQNELAKSGFTLRNGDENLHYYQFTKADGALSRVASFYLLRQPELLWNPVPGVNARIQKAKRPASSKALSLPPGSKKPTQKAQP